ncbi:MAG: GGDEF domain-containing protein, partial [Pseudomonadota bacterium]
NNTSGHAAGDALLQHIGERLGEVLKEHQVHVARLGGDEFGVLVESVDAEAARNAAQTVLTMIRDERFTWEGRHYSLSVSIGLVFVDEAIDNADSALRFATVFDSDPRANAVRIFAAEALFADGELADAIAAAEPVTQTSEDPALLRTAWTVTGHANFERLQFADAERAYLELRALGARDEAEREALDERLAATIYKQGEAARNTGDVAMAVEHFLRVGATVPGTEAHPVADFDAAAVLMGAENWQAALPLLENFSRKHPGHALEADVQGRLALTLENTGQPGRAADSYVRIADTEADPVQRSATLWHAAELYRAAGDGAAAAGVYTTLANAPGAAVDERMDAQQALIELARERGDATAERRWLTAQIDADRDAGAARSNRTRALAADASMTLALPTVEAYRAVTLTVPLKESLREKKGRMESALAALNAAAGYGVATVSTQAGYLVAELYYDFSRALMESERPADLDELALEEYEFLLEEQAFPFEEKAIDIHQLNAARAADGIYDRWVKDSFARLAEMLPVRFAKTEVSDGLIERLD